MLLFKPGNPPPDMYHPVSVHFDIDIFKLSIYVCDIIHFTNSCLENYISPKPITKTMVDVSSPEDLPQLWSLSRYAPGFPKKQLKSPPVSPFPLPPLLDNWKPLSIGAGVPTSSAADISHSCPLKFWKQTKYWAGKPFYFFFILCGTECRDVLPPNKFFHNICW